VTESLEALGRALFSAVLSDCLDAAGYRSQAMQARIRPLDERLAEIRAVSAADVQRVAASYLPPGKRSVVHVLPGAENDGNGAAAGGAR